MDASSVLLKLGRVKLREDCEKLALSAGEDAKLEKRDITELCMSDGDELDEAETVEGTGDAELGTKETEIDKNGVSVTSEVEATKEFVPEI